MYTGSRDFFQGSEGAWLITYMYVLVFDQIKLCLKWLQLHAMHGHWSWKRGNSPKHLSTIQYIIISCTFKLLQRAKSRTVFKRQCSKDCMFTHTTSHYNLKMFKLLWHTHLYSRAHWTYRNNLSLNLQCTVLWVIFWLQYILQLHVCTTVAHPHFSFVPELTSSVEPR